MALKILRIANSSVYSRGDRVDTVHQALLRIGMQSIRQVVLNIGVVERFSSPAFKDHLATSQFWEHSITCGIIAAEIAHAQDAKEADSAFTSGLLHDLGRVVLAEALGDQCIQVIETARRLEAPLELVETRMLLLNHADVMDRLLSAWKFPKHMVDPITFHHASAGSVRSAAPARVPEILRLGLANRLAHAMLLGNSGNETIYPTEEYCRALNISAALDRAAVRVRCVAVPGRPRKDLRAVGTGRVAVAGGNTPSLVCRGSRHSLGLRRAEQRRVERPIGHEQRQQSLGLGAEENGPLNLAVGVLVLRGAEDPHPPGP